VPGTGFVYNFGGMWRPPCRHDSSVAQPSSQHRRINSQTCCRRLGGWGGPWARHWVGGRPWARHWARHWVGGRVDDLCFRVRRFPVDTFFEGPQVLLLHGASLRCMCMRAPESVAPCPTPRRPRPARPGPDPRSALGPTRHLSRSQNRAAIPESNLRYGHETHKSQAACRNLSKPMHQSTACCFKFQATYIGNTFIQRLESHSGQQSYTQVTWVHFPGPGC
jgi:hypothetical protein